MCLLILPGPFWRVFFVCFLAWSLDIFSDVSTVYCSLTGRWSDHYNHYCSSHHHLHIYQLHCCKYHYCYCITCKHDFRCDILFLILPYMLDRLCSLCIFPHINSLLAWIFFLIYLSDWEVVAHLYYLFCFISWGRLAHIILFVPYLILSNV